VDFFEVLDRVVDLLRSRGRVTYGALKLQFQLDDAQVEVLKDELIYAPHLAVDEDGRVLVWRGEEHSTPPSPSPHADQSDIIQDAIIGERDGSTGYAHRVKVEKVHILYR
jgi:hypothetical protein